MTEPRWGVVKIKSNGDEHWLGPSSFVAWSGTESEALAVAERAVRFGRWAIRDRGVRYEARPLPLKPLKPLKDKGT